MDVHPEAEIFPPMTDGEYQALLADIREYGLREPIVVHEGKILDGRHRYRACVELGVTPTCVPFVGKETLIEFVLSINLRRRHLTQSQKAMIAAEATSFFADEAKTRQGMRTDRLEEPERTNARMTQGKATEHAARLFGVSSRYVEVARQVNTAAPALAKQVRNGAVKLTSALQRIHRERVHAEARQRAAEPAGEDVRIIHADFRGIELPPESVDMIFTDPPYCREAVPLYADLSRLAAQALRPGGWCLSYSGTAYLPEVVAGLATHLTYGWTFAIGHIASPTNRFHPLNVRNEWKPIFGFFKPPLDAWWPILGDFRRGGGREKDLHPWQQCLSDAEYFIAAMCPEGGLVCDPCCGSGTTCVAALRLGRRVIGIDIDPAAVTVAKSRLAQAQTEQTDAA